MDILIIKFGAMGDVLRTTSILPGLKEKYKDGDISWLTKDDSKDLVKNNPYVDKVYGAKSIKSLEGKKFDLVINLEEDFDACALATKLDGKKIGFYLKDGKIVPTSSAQEWFNMSVLGKKPDNDKLKRANKKTYQQLMLEMLGINPKNYDIYFRLNKNQKDYVEHFARQFNVNKKDLVIGLNTGSGGRWPQKMWGVEKTARLAERLYKELKAKVILFGGPEEVERNNEIIALARVPIINAGCGNDLKEFPALVSLCNVFVTSDSLGLHVAIGLKRKIVALFGPSSAPEIEMYDLGTKVVPDLDCICCYKNSCDKKPNCMDLISVDRVFNEVKGLLKDKISIIITAYKEPQIGKAIESFLKQNIDYEYELVVACPDKETKEIVEEYTKKNKHVKYFKDPGKGKSYAINLLFKKLKSDILIFSDGDVFVEDNSVNEIMELFKDPAMGCVGGRVVSSSSKNNMVGYWSHLLADAGAHNIRKELFEKGEFLECSAYLFAFRNIIKEIPLDVAEDAVIPYMFWEKGYTVGYAENAVVYVKNPDSFKDWLKQRKRTSKAHETLEKYVDVERIPRVKSFSNEVKKGFFWALAYPKNIKEFYWTFCLFFARLYMWGCVFIDTKMRKKHYQDAWERVHTAR